jgi:hypothetical protein
MGTGILGWLSVSFVTLHYALIPLSLFNLISVCLGIGFGCLQQNRGSALHSNEVQLGLKCSFLVSWVAKIICLNKLVGRSKSDLVISHSIFKQ